MRRLTRRIHTVHSHHIRRLVDEGSSFGESVAAAAAAERRAERMVRPINRCTHI